MKSQTWILAATAALALSAASTPAHALNGCASNLLNGSYAMQFSGSASSARLAGLARLSFDADGNVQGSSSVNANGTWQTRDVSGTFEVRDDCTVSFSLIDTNGITQNFAGVLAEQAESVLVIQTDAGAQVSGSLTRVRNFCQASDISGSFGLQYQGVLSDKAQTSLNSVGLIAIDVDGNVTSSELRTGSGAFSQVASAGNIVVNADCSALLTLAPITGGGASVNFAGMLAADGRRVVLVQADAGAAVIGTITAQ
jgi:hypothetical protein